MKFEVEKKYWLDSIHPLMERLRGQGLTFRPAVDQVDKYFAHPARDFAKTDEAFRLRRVGIENYVTYKGARIDSSTKTRRELELQLPNGDFVDSFEQLLRVLGFEPVMTVHKVRQQATLSWEGYEVEICLDEIDQLGSFVELETCSDLEHLEKAKAVLASLASSLNLDRQEHRSYLELMLNQLSPQRISG
jgi:adenylate cyclase class 2